MQKTSLNGAITRNATGDGQQIKGPNPSRKLLCCSNKNTHQYVSLKQQSGPGQGEMQATPPKDSRPDGLPNFLMVLSSSTSPRPASNLGQSTKTPISQKHHQLTD
jgi:hypothetical protein